MNGVDVDAPPSADVPRRGGFLGFLGTLPGILTSVAGVITAVGTVYAVQTGSPPPPPPPAETTQAPPADPVDADSVADRAGSAPAADGDVLSDDVPVLWADCANGYVDACVSLVDQLVLDCDDGDPYSCDALYWLSPVGSDYELFGATCGYRFERQDGRCYEL